MLSSAKSMDDKAVQMAALRDPKRMAALLVRAFSSSMAEEDDTRDRARPESRQRPEEEDEEVEETQEEFQELETRAMAEQKGFKLETSGNAEEEDDDDDAEEEEEEEEEEENADKPLDEEELEAAATALETAMRIVKELRLKMLLKAGQQIDRQRQDHDHDMEQCPFPVIEMTPPFVPRAEHGTVFREAPGQPVPSARMRGDAACNGCGKSFHPFHRSKNCAACGFGFCPKCSTKALVLPTCFGYRDEAVRTCNLCARWFQKALDHYFDAMELTASQELEEVGTSARLADGLSGEKAPIVLNTSNLSDGVESRPRLSASPPEATLTDSSDGIVLKNGENDPSDTTSSLSVSSSRQRPRRSSTISAPSPNMSKTKPWFSGHLRAMHVNDRLPRKKKAKGEIEGDAEGSNQTPNQVAARRRYTSSVASAMSKPRHLNDDSDDRSEDKQEESARDQSSADSATQRGSFSVDLVVRSDNFFDFAQRQIRARRSKFSRSASFDLTNLPSVVSPDASLLSPTIVRHHTFGADELVSISNRSATHSKLSKKAFDDSDIVDACSQPDSAETKLKNEAKLAAAVLRFAVYETGRKEGTGFRRTFGFSRANPLLDRYTLELDCRQRIVRAKSVFMHRFRSFHCDSVQSFVSGSSEGLARLVVSNRGQENQKFELRFANDDEREQFKQAINSCQSANMREFASKAAQSSSARRKRPISSYSDSVTSQEPSTTFSINSATSIESELLPFLDAGANNDTESPLPQSIHVPLLLGEAVVKGTELLATLLIGPASETYEASLVWRRSRGKVAVTNYRVIFLPFESAHAQSQSGRQGENIAYIPLFAITHVQLLYPGGRRTKTGRASITGAAHSTSIISISCKDFRVMRLQLDSVPSVSSDLAHKLRATISKLADASQRYSIVEQDGSAHAASPLLTSTLPSSRISSEIPLEGDGDRSEANKESVVHPARNVVGAVSPVFRAYRTSTLPREVSGSFAFSYFIGDIPPDQNGWNVFVDEQEFKRQIGGDPAVPPFLKYYKNERGNICRSYPSKLLLPASMNSTTLAKVADFRAKNRLPVITYYHRRNRCVLTRSSQPLLGSLLSGTSNVSDQLLLGVYRRLPDIIKNQSQASTSSRPLYIFDARKPKASTGNRLMGKGGVETSQDYPGAVIHHLNISNMYRMQSSLMGLMKLFLPGGIDDTDRTWLSSLESTRWLDHVRLVLDGALKIARVLELEGASALVHCSDGWDRTSQLCALAQLMIDPYYRTIRGMICLIEKDWCAFGHKFSERTGGDRNRDPQRNKSSPIMLQFIDAVWQIQRQYPRSFEFNERFLLHVANAMTSGLYGTFLYDSRLQRDINQVKEKTVSVWTPVLMMPSLYSNHMYEMYDGAIWPWVSCKMIRLWDNYFFQWHPKFYKCQWACSLVHHGPSRSDVDDTSGESHEKSVETVELPRRGILNGREPPPALDLLAASIASTVAEDGGEQGVSMISVSFDEKGVDESGRVRAASGTFGRKTSMRNLFSLNRTSRQRAQSVENGSQEIY
ncbi:hypothetical protein PsorP6_008214 [Peronosclerospora sorghi]|uniref:Uncharacterized protein n=1 Tax=Peronosclerospora sorghi TaxID=230839 RepID=A0ACC0W765_9STRA|nr:hypothetical protein PsorP6_008214 [Peronosclerospora sorghi]